MVSKQHLTMKQLAIVVFFFATLFLLLGLFLSTVNPVAAQTGATGTATSGVSSTATSGVAVTGSTTVRNAVDLNQLKSFTVVDRDGNKVGSVSDFVFDLRNAAVCAPASSSTSGGVSSGAAGSATAVATSVAGSATAVATSMTGSATAVATGTSASSSAVPVTGSNVGWAACKVTNASQSAGQVAFVVVSRSGVSSSTSTTTSATAVATGTAMSGSVSSTANTQFTGDNVVIPWRMVRVDLDNQTLIVNAPACVFNTAPGYDTSNVPDFFTGAFASAVTTFWANPNAACSTSGVPVTGSNQATSVATSTVVSTSTSGGTGAVATTAPTSAVVSTTAPTATEVAVTPSETTVVVTPTEVATSTSAVGGVATSTSVAGVGGVTATVPATVSAPVAQGSPTALVPVTGIDLNQVKEAAVAQRRMLVDIGIVGVGLVLLALGVVLKTGKH